MPPDHDASPAHEGPVDDIVARTAELFRRWRDGDRSACVALFALHKAWIEQHVAHSLGPRLLTRLEPEDIVQEIGIRLLCYEPNAEDGAIERFRGLLRTMTRHVITDEHRYHFDTDKRGSGEVQLPTDSKLDGDPTLDRVPSPDGKAGRRADVALARVAFWFLPPEKRDVVGLRWWYDVPFADLARRFGCEEATLRMRHLRATQELAVVMAKVRTALQRLPPAARDLLESQAGYAISSGSSVDSRVLARSRIDRFAAFLDALEQVAHSIGEKLIPLPDSWPRTLLAAPPGG